MSKPPIIESYTSDENLRLIFTEDSDASIEKIIQKSRVRLVKQDKESYSAIVDIKEKNIGLVFVKIYKQKTVKRKLQFLFGRRRGYRAWQSHCQLADAGLSVPHPLIYLREGSLEIIISEYKVDMIDLRHFIGNKRINQQFEEFALMTKAAELISAMHSNGFVHGDCKWGNFLWSETDSALSMVDFDGVKNHQIRRAAKDLARFMINAEEAGIEQDQINQFVSCYTHAMERKAEQSAEYSLEALMLEVPHIMERIRLRHRKKK